MNHGLCLHAKTFCWIVYIAVVTGWVAASQATELPVSVPTFLSRYCLGCHDDENHKGDRSFESLVRFHDRAGISTDERTLTLLSEVVDQLNLGDMPPRDADISQPDDRERAEMVAGVTRYLNEQRESHRPRTTVLRRLTRYEYQYTLRDLLGLDTESIDNMVTFPPDLKLDGFANIGSEQPLSEQQLQLYLQVAQRYIDEALVFGKAQPPRQHWTFKPIDFVHSLFEDARVAYRVIDKDETYIDIGHGEPVERYPTFPMKFSQHGVPIAGVYRVRIKATAVGRRNDYDRSLFKADLSVPLKLGLWHVPNQRLLAAGASEGRVFVGAFDLVDDVPTWSESTVWMPAGSSLFVHWINGEGSSKPLLGKIRSIYHPDTIVLTDVEIDQLREQGKAIPQGQPLPTLHLSDVYQGPRVRLFEMTLEGPLYDQWPPASHRRVVGEQTDPAGVNIGEVMTNFAATAFRRPIDPKEIDHYVQLVHQKIDSGVARDDALKLGLAAILASPKFLYLDEGNEEADRWLTDFELASRLSFFLWSSMPDERLLELAERKELAKPETIVAEALRMLDDPRSEALTKHFVDAWLRLDKLGSMPPSTAQFPTYYFHRLETAMREETRSFFRYVLSENRPVTDFINADYTFVNDALARHYGFDNVMGESFRKVMIPDTMHRGGLLGHASVLTASANGVETSPVVRGVWVLESLLGTPPAAPPPDVPAIEPDTRGATTIREQLAKHRSVVACAECHAKIDPWGFALEYFDPVGAYRDHYTIFTGRGRIARRREGKAIDGSSSLPSGIVAHDEADLRRELLARKDLFTRNLTTKLLMYACGREMTFADSRDIQAIADIAGQHPNGLRDLVLAIVASETFRSR